MVSPNRSKPWNVLPADRGSACISMQYSHWEFSNCTGSYWIVVLMLVVVVVVENEEEEVESGITVDNTVC